MPIYEYECPRCGLRFEKMQAMRDQSSLDCPKCGGVGKRMISSNAVVLSREGGRGVHRPREQCERVSPCCGREVRCEKRPCDEA